MKDSMTGLSTFESQQQESRSRGLTLTLGVIAALVVTALLVSGYLILRKRHAQHLLAATQNQQPSTQPKAPPKVLILVDEAMLKGDQTIIGGTVKNISNEELTALSVNLELKRRKNGATEHTLVPIAPEQLKPQQEGRYSVQLRSADYSAVKLVGLKSGPESALVAFTQMPGQKRTPEKPESRTIVTGRPGSPGGFLNSPDNPARVP